MTEKKLTSYQWLEHLKEGVTIFDPDGWDRKNFIASMSEPITAKEFEHRFAMSTVQCPAYIEGGDNSIWKRIVLHSTPKTSK